MQDLMCSEGIRTKIPVSRKQMDWFCLKYVYVNFSLLFLFLVKYVTDSNHFWTSSHPESWSEHNVCEWLQSRCDQYNLDAKCISISHFNINGLQSCNKTWNSSWMLQTFVENTCISSYRIAGCMVSVPEIKPKT